jgi:NAD(P)-dependent dehydrogenase (short-subunit alcohol dehydrogenase family)
MSLQGKVAIVTGGGQGIGKAIARRFLVEGLKVVIAEIDEEAGKETEAEFKSLGSIRFIQADVSDESSVKNLIGTTNDNFRSGIDVLVNNAALAFPENPIINIASTRALMSEPNTEAYSASKGGLLALTHALAISLGPDIRVNCISPGWIEVSEWKKQATRHNAELTEQDHQQHPAGRVGKPEDIASLAVYFASPEADFITGANFVIDGGMTKKMIYL